MCWTVYLYICLAVYFPTVKFLLSLQSIALQIILSLLYSLTLDMTFTASGRRLLETTWKFSRYEQSQE
jgi:hypothetical protein